VLSEVVSNRALVAAELPLADECRCRTGLPPHPIKSLFQVQPQVLGSASLNASITLRVPPYNRSSLTNAYSPLITSWPLPKARM
jgi:hypothetical protein